MKSRSRCFVIAVVLFLMLISVFSCAKPAKFEVVSLDVTPSEVTVGDKVSVVAQIRNVGGTDGTYTAVLTVDGKEVERKSIVIAPGATQSVTFLLIKEKAGSYRITVGELSSSLTVKEKLIVKEIELKHDDGDARDALSSVRGGHLVCFSPTATPFIIKKIHILGVLSPRGENLRDRNFDIEIWDKNRKVLYSANYPYTKFSIGIRSWVEFVVPDIVVTDKFYVHVYTNSPRFGLHIGADDSVVNKHSDVTFRTAEGVATTPARWPYSPDLWFGDKSKVNWMIRVVGTAMDPKLFTPVKPPIQIQFLGHAGFRIWDNSTILLVDPWLSYYRGHTPFVRAEEVDEATLILLTHEHPDHMDIRSLRIIVANTGAKIAGPDVVVNTLKGEGIPQEKLVRFNRGQSLTQGPFKITAIPSGTIQGFLIQSPTATIYVSGDEFNWDPTAIEVKKLVESLDIALLAVADPRAYPGGYSAFETFVKLLRPRIVVPMHELREIPFKAKDHEIYAKVVSDYGGTYKVPKLGEIFEMPIRK